MLLFCHSKSLPSQGQARFGIQSVIARQPKQSIYENYYC